MKKLIPNGESPVQNKGMHGKAVSHVKSIMTKPASIAKTGYYNDSKSKMKAPKF